MELTKKQIDHIDGLNAQIQKLIDNGGSIRQWNGVQPTTDDFPEKNTFNVNVIVPQELFNSCSKAYPKLSGSGQYFRGTFYDTDMVCNGMYESKYDKDADGAPALELQFTLENTPAIQEYGTEESHTKFTDALKNYRNTGAVANLPTRERKEVKESVKETIEDPFA